MVEVRFEQLRGDFYSRFKAKFNGHALYNPGNDIVCASVSSHAYTLYAALKNLTPSTVTFEGDSGDLTVGATYPQYSHKDVDMIVKSIGIGLLQIAKTYPENVKVYFDPSILDMT